jgi:Tfp pilus assembly protein PilF
MSALDQARSKVEEANIALRMAFDLSKHDPGGAAQEFAKLCARFPQAAAPLVGLAHVQRLIGADEDAARLLDLALKVEPTYADALNNLAVIRRKQNRHDDAARR